MENKLDTIKLHVDNIKDDMSQVKEDISEIKVTMGINTKSLEVHIKRTDDLQSMVEEFKKHILFVNAAFKVVIALGSLLLAAQQLGLLSRFL